MFRTLLCFYCEDIIPFAVDMASNIVQTFLKVIRYVSHYFPKKAKHFTMCFLMLVLDDFFDEIFAYAHDFWWGKRHWQYFSPNQTSRAYVVRRQTSQKVELIFQILYLETHCTFVTLQIVLARTMRTQLTIEPLPRLDFWTLWKQC